MAVPNEEFGLVAVITEIDKYGEIVLKADGTGGSLVTAFAAADEGGFVGAGRDSLLDFAGYEQPDPGGGGGVTYTEYSLGYASSGPDACSDASISPVTVWGDPDTNFDLTENLYANDAATVNASAGYYADFFYGYRYWDGNAFGTGPGSSGSCGF